MGKYTARHTDYAPRYRQEVDARIRLRHTAEHVGRLPEETRNGHRRE